MKEHPRDHRVEAAALGGDRVGLEAASAPPGPVAGGEHGREVRGGERRRLAAAALGGGPPIAGQDAGGSGAGRGRLAGEPRAEGGRGDRERGARRRAPHVVEPGEVEGEGHIVERAAGEPGVELPERGRRRRGGCSG